MPRKQSRIPESSQPLVLAVAMVAVLLASLLMSYGLVVYRPAPVHVEVEGLELTMPAGWQAESIAEAPARLISAVSFIDPSADRRIFIARDGRSAPRAPLVALNEILNLVLVDEVDQGLESAGPVQQFRAGTAVGIWYTGVVRSEARSSLHQIAVLSENARAYWVVKLSHTIEDPERLPEALVADRALFQPLIRGATNLTMRDAIAPDLTGAGLSALSLGAGGGWPDGLRGRVDVDGPAGAAVYALPSNTGSTMATLRVMGVVDAGGAGLGEGVSPQALLEAHLRKVLGLPSGGGHPGLGVWSGRIGTLPVWRVAYPLSGGSLQRQLWYALVGPGRGLLVEVLGEPLTIRRASQWVATLVSACAVGTGSVENNEAGGAISEAMERGAAVVQHQWVYVAGKGVVDDPLGYLISTDGRRRGFYFERGKELVAGSAGAAGVGGESVMVLAMKDQPIEIDQIWGLDPRGKHFIYTTRRARLSDVGEGGRGTNVSRLEGTGAELLLRRLLPTPEAKLWSATVPGPYLGPMSENHWSSQSLAVIDSKPALVWMTPGTSRPQPFWVTWEQSEAGTLAGEGNDATASDGYGGGELLVRPMMGLDADRLRFDDQGRLVSFTSSQFTNGFGGALVEVSRVELEELFKAYPALRSHFEPAGATEQPDE